MSAIWGNISYSGNQPDNAAEILKTDYETKYRIDRIEEYTDNSCIMGCGIQYITDESVLEKLPVHNPDKQIYFTADCILDNRNELLSKLNMSGTAIPDGELIYKAFLKWGIDCVKHLRGLFSFAVYNAENKVLYLAADQLANRCLYYHRHSDGVTFSTLLLPIKKLHPDITHNINYIKDFLTAPGLMPNIVPEETHLSEVFKLRAGTYVTITPSSIKETVYWTPALDNTFPACKSAAEYGTAFRALYSDCVKDALRTNGNVAISLSSGLDSGSVGALAATHLAKENKKLYAYTYVPYENPGKAPKNIVLDETSDVMKLADMYPNIIPHFMNNNGRNCFMDIDKAVDILEIPIKAFVNMPSILEIYSTVRQNGCKIALTGQYGNSTVSQGNIAPVLYDLYSKHHYFTYLSWLNKYSLSVKESRKKNLKGSIKNFNKATHKFKEPYMHNYIPDNPFLAENILENYPIKKRYYDADTPMYDGVPMSGHYYRRHLHHQAALTYLGELDTKLGLANGIIIRDATRDMRMLSFCYHMPYKYFAYQGIPRWLIRHNLKDMLPDNILSNRLRFCKQNSDWLIRFQRDMDILKPRLSECLNASNIKNYINPEKAQTFLNKTKFQEDDRIVMGALMYFILLSKSLSK